MTAALAARDLPRVKSPEAFRTISEVATELDVPQHVLRFWESRFAQVRPVKRAGGRRYYRPDDVDLLKGIRTLLYSDGFTIKGVQKVLRDHGTRYVAEIGRGKASLLRPIAGFVPDVSRPTAPRPEPSRIVAVPDSPTHARAAIAAVEQAHAEVVQTELEEFIEQSTPKTDEQQRIRLELLMGELLHLKDRLIGARDGGAC